MGLRRRAVGVLGALAITAAAACAPESDPVPADDGPEVAASARCLRAQGAWTWQLQRRLQTMTERVLSAPEQSLDGAAVRLRALLGTVERRTLKQCGGGRTPLVPLVELAYRRDDDVVDDPLLRDLVDALGTFAKAVGHPGDGRIVYAADPCALVDDAVDATYAVHTRPEAGGTAAWVEIRVTNHWRTRLMLEHGGAVRVTGLAPDGRSRRLDWGGSSADSAMVGRDRTARIVPWPTRLPDQTIHLLPGGTARAFDVYLSAYSTQVACGISVQPRAPRR